MLTVWQITYPTPYLSNGSDAKYQVRQQTWGGKSGYELEEDTLQYQSLSTATCCKYCCTTYVPGAYYYS